MQPPHELHTIFTEIQHYYFNDFNLSQDMLTILTHSSPIANNAIDNNAIVPTSPKPLHTLSLPFFDPSFFAQSKAFHNFFLPFDTFLTVPILLQAQKDDPVLSTVYKWLKQKQKPYTLTPVIKANSFLYAYYKQFQHLYIDPHSHLIQYYTPNSRVFEEIFIKSQPSINQTRICLPFKLFYAAFSKTHSHGHSGEKLSIKTFNQFYFLYGSLFSFMFALNVKLINTFLLNLKEFLLLSLLMRKLLTSTTGFLWILKVLYLHHLKIIHIFL